MQSHRTSARTGHLGLTLSNDRATVELRKGESKRAPIGIKLIKARAVSARRVDQSSGLPALDQPPRLSSRPAQTSSTRHVRRSEQARRSDRVKTTEPPASRPGLRLTDRRWRPPQLCRSIDTRPRTCLCLRAGPSASVSLMDALVRTVVYSGVGPASDESPAGSSGWMRTDNRADPPYCRRCASAPVRSLSGRSKSARSASSASRRTTQSISYVLLP